MKGKQIAGILLLICVLNLVIAFMGVGDKTGVITIFEILMGPSLIGGIILFGYLISKPRDETYCSVNSCYYADTPRRKCTCSECGGKGHGVGKYK